MDSDPESSECPLCLEVLEADDLNFYPCTCCYQICRFCWHRIRTDENGLCPACRKPYSENPAQFKPLTDEEVQQVKRDRKLKESNKKPKITESRKHLANLRVVQRNLVFVNGLPARLADTELLRRNDHFGKFGKIVKLVTSPAHNGQSNSICVYITYSRSEEALRAIQTLCNHYIDGRTLKATLGTTKYCSRYLKGATCQKADCLYLHEPGDPLASFTKEQMQQGLHLEYERKLMEQFINKNASIPSKTTPKSSRNLANGHKNDSSQRRKNPVRATPFLSQNTTVLSTNGHSDLESGDETQHHPSNGYGTEAFASSTLINVDYDSTSTSSQTSSEHDPQIATSTNQTQSFQVSPNHRNRPDERTTFFNTTDYVPSQTNTNNSTTSSSNDVSNKGISNIQRLSNQSLLTELTSNHGNNTTMKNVDQIPEYKPFSSNIPSIQTMLFSNYDHHRTNSAINPSLLNGLGHDVRDIEKKFFEHSSNNGDGSSSFPCLQENDELGFDPCSLFISGLALDVEDEQKPSSSTVLSRFPSNGFHSFSSQISSPTTQTSGQTHTNWFSQHPPQLYPPQYIDQQATSHINGTILQKQALLQPHLTQQQRYILSLNNGSSSRSTWDGNGQPSIQPQSQQNQQQPQYTSQIPTRLDVSNQIQTQRVPSAQALTSPRYSQSINSNHHHKSIYSSNSTQPTNNVPNDTWPNPLSIDPAIISFGHKLDTSSPQWSSTTQLQGTSSISSGNNLMTSRWPQLQSQSVQYPFQMKTNGIFTPFSTAPSVDDASRS